MSELDGGFFSEKSENKPKNCLQDDLVILPISENECCEYCKSIPILYEIKKLFNILVCYSCSRSELNFITKTDSKNRFLLTEEEIRQFKYLSRPNPHKGSWNEMQLYLEKEIIEFSISKHGSFENIEAIKTKRKDLQKKKKMDKVKKRVKELKKRTFLVEKEERHAHKFIRKDGISKCKCGMEIEEEEL